MENAADALKMAGAVLLFVLAISIIILSFGQVRESADTIIDYRDRETSYIEGNYYYEGNDNNSRIVGLETIIPSIYRAYLENYKIVFSDGLLGLPIYKIGDSEKYLIDLENSSNETNITLGNDEAKVEFIQGILYGKNKDNKDVYSDTTAKQNFESKFNISLSGCESIHSQLSKENVPIIEDLGVYYQNDSADVSDANKTKKRIITYSAVK